MGWRNDDVSGNAWTSSRLHVHATDRDEGDRDRIRTTQPGGAATYARRSAVNSTEGQLVLADGNTFEGDLIGAHVPIATGEVVFNTCTSGYQEVITDPSYAGQIITFTSPHIGNHGINATDFESTGTFCRGVVIPRPGAAAQQLPRTGRPRLHALPAGRPRHRRHRHTPTHPVAPRRRSDSRGVRFGVARRIAGGCPP